MMPTTHTLVIAFIATLSVIAVFYVFSTYRLFLDNYDKRADYENEAMLIERAMEQTNQLAVSIYEKSQSDALLEIELIKEKRYRMLAREHFEENKYDEAAYIYSCYKQKVPYEQVIKYLEGKKKL